MVIKTFEYSVLNGVLPQNNPTVLPVFSLEIANKATYVVHRALKIANLNNSQFSSSTKTKSEVRGGGRKPWKQKGTGNARSGSKRSPLWRGGGITFGPKPRVIYKKLNKKEKQLALRTLIYNKRNKFEVFEKFELTEIKTNNFLKNFNLISNTERILVISSKPNKNLQLSVQNCKNIQYMLANQMNITDLAKANKIIIDELSFNVIKELYCAKL